MSEVVEETNQVETQEERLAELAAIIISEDYEVTRKDREEAIKGHKSLSTELADAWSFEEIKAYLEMGIEPAKTSNGVYVNDVTRSERKAGAWSDEELEAWANGEIEAVGKANDGALAQSLISRFKLKVNANTPEQAIAAYKTQVVKASVEETVEVTEVQQPAPEAVVVKAEAVEPALINENGLTKMNKNFIENTLKQYVELLKPGKAISRENGVALQKSLDNLIRYIINLAEPAGFKSGMDYLMETIKRHRVGGVFDDTYALRFTDGLPVGGNVQENHNRLLTLFFIYADADKSFRKQADVSYLTQFIAAEKQPLLLQYFEQYK